MFDTQTLIRMTSGRVEMLQTALATKDLRATSFSKIEHVERALTEARASLAALHARQDAPTYCHYCGLPTRRGACDECGTEPF